MRASFDSVVDLQIATPSAQTSSSSNSGSTSSTPSMSATTLQTVITTSTPTSEAPKPEPQESSEKPALSTGAIAGIGVGVASFVSTIVALAFIIGRKMTKDRSTPQNEARRTFTGGFLPRGSLSDEPDKIGLGLRTDSSDNEPVPAIPPRRMSYEVAGSEPTVGQLRVPMRELPQSMTVRRPEKQKPIYPAELPSSNEVHELP